VLRSMYSGVSGLRTHQTMMDVVGNNIANVNTSGFKSSSTVFQDVLSQTLQGAGAPGADIAGTNPAQVGLGVRLAGVSTNFNQGALQLTGRSTDLAIQGDGFFAVRRGAETLFTRAGSFSFDANGTLVSPNGAAVQGWDADETGAINTNAPVGDIRLPIGTLLAPTGTTAAEVGGNLPADAADGAQIVSSITTYDAQGNEQNLTYTFTKAATPENTWNLDVATNGGTATRQALTFDDSGQLTTPAGGTMTADGVEIDLSGLTQFGGGNTVAALSQNGSAMGALQSFTIGGDGTLVGVFSNGLRQPLGQIALASFANPGGMEKIGDSMYRPSVNSGNVQIGTAATGGRGTLAGGTLEMSNVDLAQEFTNLIVAQRGFQANSRIITASDELLQDVVNLKR
jgi:flagellar hook protein FlgE